MQHKKELIGYQKGHVPLLNKQAACMALEAQKLLYVAVPVR